jgi:hypothetical protein
LLCNPDKKIAMPGAIAPPDVSPVILLLFWLFFPETETLDGILKKETPRAKAI